MFKRFRNFWAVIGVAFGACAAGLGGCAAGTARAEVLAPALMHAWPGVEEDALLGVRVRETPAAAAALDVEVVHPGVAQQRLGRIHEFGEAVKALKGP